MGRGEDSVSTSAEDGNIQVGHRTDDHDIIQVETHRVYIFITSGIPATQGMAFPALAFSSELIGDYDNTLSFHSPALMCQLLVFV